MHVHPAIPDIRINQVRIDCVLVSMLVPRLDLPVVFGFELTNPRPNHKGVALIAFVGKSRGSGAVVRFEVNGEVTENSHW